MQEFVTVEGVTLPVNPHSTIKKIEGMITELNETAKQKTNLIPDNFFWQKLKEASNLFIKSSQTEYNETLNEITEEMIYSINQGGCIYIIGNGGSASQAEHIRTELVHKFYNSRKPIKAKTLDSIPSITAIANDWSFVDVFERQVEAEIEQGDILWVLSTSGNSGNIINAVTMANRKNAVTIAFTGKGGGQLKDKADYSFIVPSEDTPRIQEIHLAAAHCICELLEKHIMQ